MMSATTRTYCYYIFIFIRHNMVEKKKNRDKHSNKKEAHKDMYMDYRIRRKKQWLI